MSELWSWELAEIEARAEAATPGPWGLIASEMISRVAPQSAIGGLVEISPIARLSDDSERTEDYEGAHPDYVFVEPATDGEFFIHARTDVLRLVASLRSAQATVAERDKKISGMKATADQCGQIIDLCLRAEKIVHDAGDMPDAWTLDPAAVLEALTPADGSASPGEGSGTGAGEREAQNGSQGAMDAAIEAAAAATESHYIDLSQTDADGHTPCICGQWWDGAGEPGWDEHMADIGVRAAEPLLRQAVAEEIALRLRDAGLVGAVEIAREVGRG